MKFSNETISVLKNFGAINQGILFKQGKKLKTVSSHKNILAEADITEEIPSEFGIYDLNNFLSVISLHKDDPSFEFDDKQVTIVGNKGRSKIKYRFTPANMIVTPPEKQLTMPDAEIKFELKAEDFEWVLRAASVLSSPQIAIDSDGSKVSVVTLDLQNDAAHTDALEIADGNGDKYRMIFKTENITKILSGSYDISISSRGISHFKNKTLPLQYWITTEQGSKFQKGA
jgi:hypothetical protein